MDVTLLEKLEKQLHNNLPLVGAMQQRSAVKKLAEDGTSQSIALLVQALDCTDSQAAAGAVAALRGLTDKEAVDTLCRLAIQNPGGKAAKICIEAIKRPRDPEELCLLLFVTRQIDEFFKHDPDFQNLRLAYERADEKVKSHVMEVVRSGDKRCLGFFGGAPKPLSQCTPSEISIAIDSAMRHQDWARLFRAVQELPLKYGYPLIEHLRKSNWEPANAEQKSLYKQILAEANETLPPPAKDKPTSSVFEKWLAEGQKLIKLSEQELLLKLESVPPPEKVSVVAALAIVSPNNPVVIEKVENNGHWLVRLAGLATGLTGKEITLERKDDNYWVNALYSSAGVLEFWPGQATPADREKLAAAPPEAFVGKLGAVRRVLRLLINHRVAAGVWEEMIYEAGEFTGEYEDA